MELKLLGPFEVHDERGALPVGTLRPRAVLLAIHVGQTLSTERIVGEVLPRSAMPFPWPSAWPEG